MIIGTHLIVDVSNPRLEHSTELMDTKKYHIGHLLEVLNNAFYTTCLLVVRPSDTGTHNQLQTSPQSVIT